MSLFIGLAGVPSCFQPRHFPVCRVRGRRELLASMRRGASQPPICQRPLDRALSAPPWAQTPEEAVRETWHSTSFTCEGKGRAETCLRLFQCLGKSGLFIMSRKENLGVADGRCTWHGASRVQRHEDKSGVSGLFPQGSERAALDPEALSAWGGREG